MRSSATTAALERAVEVDEIVAALRPYGLGVADLAAVVHVSEPMIREWADASGPVPQGSYDRLVQIRGLVLLLADSLTAQGVSQWLHAPNRTTGDRRPVDALATGEYHAVHDAAAAFVSGDYL